MAFAFAFLLAIAAVAGQAAAGGKPSVPGAMYRPSEVYAAPPAAASDACVELLRSEPFQPDESPMPKYPDAAKEKHIEGDVSFHLEVGSGCEPDEITIDDGPEMLREPVEHAVKNWKFCQVPEGQEIRAAIAFRLNCAKK